jgi:hypothetical protein
MTARETPSRRHQAAEPTPDSPEDTLRRALAEADASGPEPEEPEDVLRRALGEPVAGSARHRPRKLAGVALSPVEEALRRALAEPPVAEDTWPDVAAPLAGLERRVVRARRMRAVGSAAAVVGVLAFGVSGAAALSRPIPQTGPSGVVADPPHRGTSGMYSNPGSASVRPVPSPPAAGRAQSANPDPTRRQPPPELLAAARQALGEVIRGEPAGFLRWAQVQRGDMIEYHAQIPLSATTTCRACQDPGGIPASGAVIELTLLVPVHRTSGQADSTGSLPYPSFSLTAAGTDLHRYGTVYEYPFRG